MKQTNKNYSFKEKQTEKSSKFLLIFFFFFFFAFSLLTMEAKTQKSDYNDLQCLPYKRPNTFWNNKTEGQSSEALFIKQTMACQKTLIWRSISAFWCFSLQRLMFNDGKCKKECSGCWVLGFSLCFMAAMAASCVLPSFPGGTQLSFFFFFF